jgi:hypothetical protein
LGAAPAICLARQRLKASSWRGTELGPVELLLNAVKQNLPDTAANEKFHPSQKIKFRTI